MRQDRDMQYIVVGIGGQGILFTSKVLRRVAIRTCGLEREGAAVAASFR